MAVLCVACAESVGSVAPETLPGDQIPLAMRGYWRVPFHQLRGALSTPAYSEFRVFAETIVLRLPFSQNPTPLCPLYRETRRGVYRLEVSRAGNVLLARLPHTPERMTAIATFERDRFIAREEGRLFEYERVSADEASGTDLEEFFVEYPMHEYAPPPCDPEERAREIWGE